ncbi:MAG: glycosyl hydrolase 108 family protein [Desulfocapsaceae bacterium]|nr:glycosyl hydrolase 108 family protein [Desulfocapsaceae bacterium]
MHFDTAFDDLIGNEGGYVNNPADPGGETNWGITVKVARENGYAGPMRDMSRQTAKAIYARRYWLPQLEALPYAVAFQVFDAAVNHGLVTAVRWLQLAVGADADGKFGNKTLNASLAADPHRTVNLFNSTRLQFYTDLAIWQTFGRGWARRVANNLRKGAA